MPERLWVWAEDGGAMRWVRTNWGRVDMGIMRVASIPEADWAFGRYQPLRDGASQCIEAPRLTILKGRGRQEVGTVVAKIA